MDRIHEHLQFPEELVLRLVEDETSLPARNVAVTLRLFAGMKNDYDLGPPLSNPEGVILISRDWVRRAVDYYRNAFIMDYSATMDGCLPQVRIKILSKEDISKAMKAMQLYRVENGGPEIAYSRSDLTSAENELYEPQEMYVDLSSPHVSTREVQIRLRRLE